MTGKTIVLGVSGGIAAYKSCELASRLTQTGATVHVVLTASAQRFVAPLTFAALTHQTVHTSLWPEAAGPAGEPGAGAYTAMPHIALADSAAAVLIAPASANVIARLAHGLADDLLTTLVLATRAPVLVAPAMNPTMLAHPATQRNLAVLAQLGYTVIAPASGRMACEHIGTGRLPTSQVIIDQLQTLLDGPGAALGTGHPGASRSDGVAPLAGRRVLVTAGPTREPLDPVRYLSNRSSGKMGYALAAEAAARGARVLLVSGPCRLATPPGVERIDVTTTAEMLDAVTAHAAACDIVIAAAAPADFRPVTAAPQKIKKQPENGAPAGAALCLELVATPDIIATVARHKTARQLLVGFAAETHDMVAQAREKLHAKHLDAVVANDVTQQDAGFDTDTNRVVWITAQSTEEWPLLSKRQVASQIFDRLQTRDTSSVPTETGKP